MKTDNEGCSHSRLRCLWTFRKMKKYWIILSALLLIGFAFVFIYQRFKNAAPIFHDSPEIAADSEKHSTRWYRKDPFKRFRGVALVVHGLNLRPERMEFLIGRLNRAGIEVLNVSLQGHGDNYVRSETVERKEARLDSFRKVTYRLWSSELYNAYRKARQRAQQKKVPLFLAGYSLGGLLGLRAAGLQAGRPLRSDGPVCPLPQDHRQAISPQGPYALSQFVLDSLVAGNLSHQ